MDPSTHAFAESREATTYTMLQRVLQNHCTTHALSLLAALTAAVLLLVGTCRQLCEAGGVEEGTLLRQTLAGLKQRVRTRPAQVPLPLRAEPDDADPQDPRVRPQTEALSRALATLLGEAAEAHQLSPEGRWRIAGALVADLLDSVAAAGDAVSGGRGCRAGPAGPRGGGATRPGSRPDRPGPAWALRRRGP